MNAANISLLNAIALIALGAAGYLLPQDPSPTAWIAVGAGIALLFCQPGIRVHNKAISHVAVLVTLLVLIGLVIPLRAAVDNEDSAAIGRVTIMLLSTAYALTMFVRSFVDAKKQREASLVNAEKPETFNG